MNQTNMVKRLMSVSSSLYMIRFCYCYRPMAFSRLYKQHVHSTTLLVSYYSAIILGRRERRVRLLFTVLS